MSYRVGVWTVKRKGKRGTTYAIRWVDPETGKTPSLSCGRDRKHAQEMARVKRAELRAGIRGDVHRLPSRRIVRADLG